ncbi:signal peptidase I [Clostridium chauvoei]|uniref:Signal peptidase I n=2 Tax=Clostridium chauvoei TaxID=46867 RepID=S6F6E0_9CLOT|nr:signal peptidase I [Clostridium chauvoei]ATD54138.1 signal peptidase I [Clostridium chauvoei]ATD58415.1 signal peptidase I [Clostridium chauvoei]MBX7281677.1 signal peptidase I [Clostridium chauvoei]MBX7284184.1 signal peptidase I [Clostridium chauvoei]MBX7286712.1 signal peptidase I [Clostridium chauvoei]
MNEEKVSKIKAFLDERGIPTKGFFYEWGIPIIVAVLLALAINKYVIFKAYIPSESMVPTLNVDDRLFVSRVYNLDKLKRGDIIVFYSEELQEDLIKRLIGLPGDEIKIVNGSVSVNGEVLVENYIGAHDNFNGEYKVPEGKYFFLGDNRLWSKDSRYWINPYIDGQDIKGKAQVKVYPFDEIGRIK